MGYSPTNVIKQYVKSDGTKCTKIDDIYAYLQAKTYRAPLVIDGIALSGGNRVIDVIAIGMDQNWLRSGQLDPIVMSLDYKTFMDLNLKYDTTFPDAGTAPYYSNSAPFYKYYLTGGSTLASTLIRSADLSKCNAYIKSTTANPWAGGWCNTSMLYTPKTWTIGLITRRTYLTTLAMLQLWMLKGCNLSICCSTPRI